MCADTLVSHQYAVIFRTHLWDDYVARQYDRLVARTKSGHVFILVDETSGPVKIDRDNVVRYTQGDVLSLGFAKGGRGNLLWFNGDYSLYLFFDRFRDYDYYIMTEYDVVVQVELDDVVAPADRDGCDFIGLSKGEPVSEWQFTETCLDAYDAAEVQKRLICIALFSRPAVQHLFDKRLELSQAFRNGALRRWPYCEAFIPTELSVGGFKLGELSEFGPTDHYDWAGVVIEAELGPLERQAFIHPVLDPNGYVEKAMKDSWPPESFFYVRSETRRKLQRVSPKDYGPPLARALRKRVASIVRNHVLRVLSMKSRPAVVAGRPLMTSNRLLLAASRSDGPDRPHPDRPRSRGSSRSEGLRAAPPALRGVQHG